MTFQPSFETVPTLCSSVPGRRGAFLPPNSMQKSPTPLSLFAACQGYKFRQDEGEVWYWLLSITFVH
jgi:hypothetical protein